MWRLGHRHDAVIELSFRTSAASSTSTAAATATSSTPAPAPSAPNQPGDARERELDR